MTWIRHPPDVMSLAGKSHRTLLAVLDRISIVQISEPSWTSKLSGYHQRAKSLCHRKLEPRISMSSFASTGSWAMVEVLHRRIGHCNWEPDRVEEVLPLQLHHGLQYLLHIHRRPEESVLELEQRRVCAFGAIQTVTGIAKSSVPRGR